MTKNAMLEEMKKVGFLKKENVTSALWNGKVIKSYVESIYKEYLKIKK